MDRNEKVTKKEKEKIEKRWDKISKEERERLEKKYGRKLPDTPPTLLERWERESEMYKNKYEKD